MNTKNIKHFLLAGTVCCGMTAALTACSDWDDHYEGKGDSASTGATTTLWEQLKDNKQLSDFCEVLENTKVYRMHKKTPVSYADMLQGGQSFTVLAPVNGQFDKAALLEQVQTVSGDSIVEKSFVQNHLSRTLASLKEDSVRMLMLNGKRLNLAGTSVEGVVISSPNNHARNGVLHVVDNAVNYHRNLYETLCDNPEFSVIGDNIRRFNKEIFDDDASIVSGYVEGVPIYIDSVVYETNPLLNNIGLLREEDSTYLVVAPTTEGWTKAYNEAASHFVFEQKNTKRDSLQQIYTMRALLEDAVFNMTDQLSLQDSAVSVPYLRTTHKYLKGKHVYNVFQKPFDEGGIFHGAEVVPCSNGTLYKTKEWPFTPEQTYFKEIYVEGETTWLITEYDKDKCVYKDIQVKGDSISEGKFLRITSTGAKDWNVTFKVSNTLSGKYDFYAVVLPKSVYPPTDPTELELPCKFKATINYLGLDGKENKYNCKSVEGAAYFESDAFKTDTILLAKDFELPVCNYQQDDVINVSVKISRFVKEREFDYYARELYLDCIYLIPSKSEE